MECREKEAGRMPPSPPRRLYMNVGNLFLRRPEHAASAGFPPRNVECIEHGMKLRWACSTYTGPVQVRTRKESLSCFIYVPQYHEKHLSEPAKISV